MVGLAVVAGLFLAPSGAANTSHYLVNVCFTGFWTAYGDAVHGEVPNPDVTGEVIVDDEGPSNGCLLSAPGKCHHGATTARSRRDPSASASPTIAQGTPIRAAGATS